MQGTKVVHYGHCEHSDRTGCGRLISEAYYLIRPVHVELCFPKVSALLWNLRCRLVVSIRSCLAVHVHGVCECKQAPKRFDPVQHSPAQAGVYAGEVQPGKIRSEGSSGVFESTCLHV